MKGNTSKTRWFIEPTNWNEMTNNSIATLIGDHNREAAGEVHCADGKLRKMYECPKGYEEEVKKAIANIPNYRLRFVIYKMDTTGIFADKAVPFKLLEALAKQKSRKKS